MSHSHHARSHVPATQNNVLKLQGSVLCKQTAMSHMQKGKDLSVSGKLICRALEQVPSLFSICCILQICHFVAYTHIHYTLHI